MAAACTCWSPRRGLSTGVAYRWHAEQRTLALGVYPAVGLTEARAARDDAKRNLAANVDPSAVKRKRERAAKIATGNTFEAVAREWHENWKGARTPYYAGQILRRLEADVLPTIGRRPIAELESPELLDMLRKVEKRGKRNGTTTKAACRADIPFRNCDGPSEAGSIRRSQGRFAGHTGAAAPQSNAASRVAHVFAKIGDLQRRAANQTCVEARGAFRRDA